MRYIHYLPLLIMSCAAPFSHLESSQPRRPNEAPLRNKSICDCFNNCFSSRTKTKQTAPEFLNASHSELRVGDSNLIAGEETASVHLVPCALTPQLIMSSQGHILGFTALFQTPQPPSAQVTLSSVDLANLITDGLKLRGEISNPMQQRPTIENPATSNLDSTIDNSPLPNGKGPKNRMMPSFLITPNNSYNIGGSGDFHSQFDTISSTHATKNDSGTHIAQGTMNSITNQANLLKPSNNLPMTQAYSATPIQLLIDMGGASSATRLTHYGGGYSNMPTLTNRVFTDRTSPEMHRTNTDRNLDLQDDSKMEQLHGIDEQDVDPNSSFSQLSQEHRSKKEKTGPFNEDQLVELSNNSNLESPYAGASSSTLDSSPDQVQASKSPQARPTPQYHQHQSTPMLLTSTIVPSIAIAGPNRRGASAKTTKASKAVQQLPAHSASPQLTSQSINATNRNTSNRGLNLQHYSASEQI